MPAISVIIPVYNTAPLLDQCLQSVTAQTFTDLEILCVNGGSTDDSAAVLTRWAERDARIRVFTQENLGAGAARNTGLNAAQGEYILFLDSDDFLAPDACETLYCAAKTDNLDAACCDFYEYQHQTGHTSPRSRALELPCKHDLDAERGDGADEFAKFAFSLPFVWGKLLRRDIIESRGLRFPSGAAEDVPFAVSYLVQCRRVKMLDGQYLCYYRVGRGGSLSGHGEKMLLDGLENFGVLENNLKRYGVWEEVKETFWFNKMVLLIGDEKLFVGRLGNISAQAVQKAYDRLRPELAELDLNIFKNRNRLFRWKVRRFRRAVAENNLKFPRRLRKLRNMLMIVLDPYYKLTAKH